MLDFFLHFFLRSIFASRLTPFFDIHVSAFILIRLFETILSIENQKKKCHSKFDLTFFLVYLRQKSIGCLISIIIAQMKTGIHPVLYANFK